MQLSLIRENYPQPTERREQRLWINPKDRGLYFGLDRIFFNYDDIDSPATLGDLDRELDRRNYFSLETKFIDSSGDLVFNTLKNNIDYNKRTNKITFKLSEVSDRQGKKVGVTIKNYKRRIAYYINNESALRSIDLLDGTESCKIVFPGDKVTSVDLTEIAKKFVVPGLYCVLSNLVVTYLQPSTNEYVSRTIYTSTMHGSKQIVLFSYNNEQSENEWRRVYNTSLSDITPSMLTLGFVLDLTSDGLLSLYLLRDSSGFSINVGDFYIESCSIRLHYSPKN